MRKRILLYTVLLMPMILLAAQTVSKKQQARQGLANISYSLSQLQTQVRSWRHAPATVDAADVQAFQTPLSLMTDKIGDITSIVNTDTGTDILTDHTKASATKKFEVYDGAFKDFSAAMPKLRDPGTKTVVQTQLDQLGVFEAQVKSAMQ